MFVFISCLKNSHKWKNIHITCSKYKIDNYIIVFGDPSIKESFVFEKCLILKCNDDYCSLPEKMYTLNQNILKFFPTIKGYLKIDDDVKILNNPTKLFEIISNHSFAGFHLIEANTQDGFWHIGRCPENPKWNKKKMDIMKWSKKYLNYNKNFKSVAGGSTYYMSKKAINCVSKTKISPNTHAFEDVMISNILASCNIFPYVPDSKDKIKITLKYVKLNNTNILMLNN
jgi:hypothetical protein